MFILFHHEKSFYLRVRSSKLRIRRRNAISNGACLVRRRGFAGYVARDKFNVIKSSNDMTQDKKDKR